MKQQLLEKQVKLLTEALIDLRDLSNSAEDRALAREALQEADQIMWEKDTIEREKRHKGG